MTQPPDFWYFSTIRALSSLTPMRRSTAAPRHIEFHRTKYGRELAIDCGYIRDLQGFISDDSPHVLGFYDITLITSGRGVYELDQHRLRFAPGTVLFTSPGQVRRWRSAAFDGLCLFFSGDFISEFFQDTLFLYRLGYFHWPQRAPRLRLTPASAAALQRRLHRMTREVRSLRADSVHVLRAMSYEVLLLLGRQFRGARSLDASPVGSGLAFRFLMLVERRFRDVHRVADYARELGVTPGHLNLRVREALGRSAGAVVRDRLIVEARRLLHYSDRTVAQIAISLGFTDASYFTRFVRRETSSTPRALRPRPGAP